MSLVKHEDESISYVTGPKIKQKDIILEKLPSEIRYIFYLIPLYEYNKYFSNEQIEKIKSFQTGENLDLTDGLIKIINYNDSKPKENYVLNILENLLFKTKKIEGYSEEQIKNFINHAILLLKQERYNIINKNIKKI